MPKKKKPSQRVLEKKFHMDIGDLVYGNMKKGLSGEFIIMELELMKLNIWSHLFEKIRQDAYLETVAAIPKQEAETMGYG